MDIDLIEAAQAVAGRFRLSEPRLTAGQVGAALRTRSGRIYTGICLDLACGLGTCAEHSAIARDAQAQRNGGEINCCHIRLAYTPALRPVPRATGQIDAKNRSTIVILADEDA